MSSGRQQISNCSASSNKPEVTCTSPCLISLRYILVPWEIASFVFTRANLPRANIPRHGSSKLGWLLIMTNAFTGFRKTQNSFLKAVSMKRFVLQNPHQDRRRTFASKLPCHIINRHKQDNKLDQHNIKTKEKSKR